MIVSCHLSLFSVFIVYPSSAPKTRRSLKDCCHSFISVPLSTCHLFIYLFIYFPTLLFRSRCQKMSAGTLGGFKICLCVPQMDCASSQRALFSRITFVPIQNFFFCISLKDCVPECPCASLFLIIPKLCPPSSVEFCRTLQTVGPSHARIYTVAVYFKGERIGCGKGPR